MFEILFNIWKAKDTQKSGKQLYSCNTQCLLVCGEVEKKTEGNMDQNENEVETDERWWVLVF